MNENTKEKSSENQSKVIILVGRSGSGKGTQGQFIKSFMVIARAFHDKNIRRDTIF